MPAKSDTVSIKKWLVINLLLLSLIFITGCAARIIKPADYGDYKEYEKVFSGTELTAAFTIEEKPTSSNIILKQPFKKFDLFVVSIKVKNTGKNTLLINRNDISLILKNGRRYIPISDNEAASRAKGRLGLLESYIGWGYKSFGLDDKIVLNSGEDKAGYLYYNVRERDYEQAREDNLHISFLRVNLIERVEHSISMGVK